MDCSVVTDTVTGSWLEATSSRSHTITTIANNCLNNSTNNRTPTMSTTGSRRRMVSDHAHAHVHVTPPPFQGLDWFSSSYKSTSLSWNKNSTAKSNNGNNCNSGYNFVVSQLQSRRETILEFNGSDFQLDYKEESIQMFLSKVLADIATSNQDNSDNDDDNDRPLTKHLRLRNLTLSSLSQQQQQLIQVLSTINNGGGLESLTLANVSSSSCSGKSISSTIDVGDRACERPSSSSSSSATLHKEVLNCDFLLASKVKLDNLTIERCRLDTESSNTLGRVVAQCQVQNFKMSNVSFVSSSSSSTTNTTTTETSKNGCDIELTGRLFGEGLGRAGSTLKTIEIRQVTCDDSQKLFSNLLRGLRSCTKLEKLHLEGCGLGSSEATTSVDHDENGNEDENENRNDDVRQLTYLVRSLQKLNTLNLYQNNINGSGLEVLLSRGLSGHPSLNKLVLSQNPIGDDGAKHLASFFSAKPTSNTNTKISSLSIVDCDIWSPGCIELIKCLSVNSTIENLDVDDEWESHLKELETALETNMTLKYLSTPQSPTQNRTSDEEWKKVEYYLRLNRAKRRILVAEPQVPRSLWPIVMGQSLKDPDVAYHLIRQCPEIME
mmetsp:Transcript_37637/g.91487  ORF Transcript_37637/g.91487 Transcript_37637/m.91487 type:complete len:606 (-) Transcript_37637:6836-8653(-)